MDQILIQGIGFLALFFVIFSFQKQKRVPLLLIMFVGLLLFVIHFYLLNAYTGAIMNLIEAGIVFVSFKKETSAWAKHNFWIYIFVCLYILAGMLTLKTASDVLPIAAQIFGGIAVWQNNPRSIRFLMLIPRPLWFIYNLFVGSYAGMIAEVFIFTSVLVGIIRFDILRQVKKPI